MSRPFSRRRLAPIKRAVRLTHWLSRLSRAINRCTFDQARLIRHNRILAKNGIAPDGTPLVSRHGGVDRLAKEHAADQGALQDAKAVTRL